MRAPSLHHIPPSFSAARSRAASFYSLFKMDDITSACYIRIVARTVLQRFASSSCLTAGRRAEEGGGTKETSGRAATLRRRADGAGEEGAGGEREEIPWEGEADWGTQASTLEDISRHLHSFVCTFFFFLSKETSFCVLFTGRKCKKKRRPKTGHDLSPWL